MRELIFKTNQVVIGGGMWIAEIPVMIQWTKLYMYYTEKYLNMNLANTDQQVMYSMLVGNETLSVKVQMYRQLSGPYSPWLYLGYLCKEEGESKEGNSSSKQRRDVKINTITYVFTKGHPSQL